MSILRKVADFVWSIIETVTFVASIFVVFYLFVAQPHSVRGASMDKTFANGQYILTNKLAYRFGPIQRGDVIVFDSPENPDIEFIKRVIGLEGDRVKVENGQVYINDKPLKEPYLAVTTSTFEGGYLDEGEETIVPDEYIFVMGDNRPRSSDSRSFGPIQTSKIVGKVFFRYFPPDVAGPIINPFVHPESVITPETPSGDVKPL